MRHRLLSPLRRTLRAGWRRYRALPRPLRWPLTAAAALILAVLIANGFSAVRGGDFTEDFRIEPGQSRVSARPIAPGGTVTVSWTPLPPEGAGGLSVTLAGPGEQQAAAGPSGTLQFPVGFSPATYTLTVTNPAADPARVRVRWHRR